jgi:RNA polymerase sigma-70 factor (ECF subfamily)
MGNAMETQRDIQSLLERAQKGDRAAFEAALGDCKDRLERFVRTRIGEHLRQEVDVEDVLQEACAQALATLACFRWSGTGSFLRWLNGIAEHVIVNLARRQRTRGSRVLYVEHDLPNGDPTPSKALRRTERFARLQAALGDLAPDYREVIHLVRIEGLRIKEAARRMNRSPKSVMHLLARALKKLKESFGDTESLGLPPERLKELGEGDGV